MNEYALTLDLAKAKQRQQQTIFVRQGDRNATTIVATITDHGVAASTSGMAARFAMRLPNGTEYYRKTATLSGNTATVTIDEAQAASAVGRTDTAYFQLLQGSTVVASTESFTVIVLPDALADATVPESYDSAIQDAIDALDAAVEQMPDMVEDVLEAHPEWTTTVQDGSITAPKLATDLALDRERLMYRLDNLLTNALPEGETATASDAAQTPVAGLALYGRSTQDGTPTPSAPVPIVSVGGNLANMAYTYPYTRTNSGITWTVNADGSIHAKGTATGNSWSHETALAPQVYLPAGTYTTYAVAPDGSVATGFRPRVALADGSVVAYDNGVKTFTVASGTTATVMLVCNTGTVADADIRLALYAGTTAYPYVPYGHTGLLARGRNLLRTTAGTQTISGVTFTRNEDGTFRTSGTSTSTIQLHLVPSSVPFLTLKAGTYTLSGCPEGGGSTYKLDLSYGDGSGGWVDAVDNGGTRTFTLAEDTTFTRLRIVIYPNTNVDNLTFRPMLEAGSTAHAYEPYTESVTPIPLDGHELRSLPDGTRDEVTIDERGHAVLVQRVGSVTLDGSETWTATNAGTTGTPRYRTTLAGLVGGASIAVNAVVQYLQCDHFPVVCDSYSNKGTYNGETGVSPRRTDDHDVWFFHEGETLDNWKTWLASNPVTIDYKLATPVTVDLGYVDAVPLCGPDLTAQAIPTAPMQLTYERDLNATLARLESAIATLA